MLNKTAVERMEEILRLMEREARKKGAPVFEAERKSASSPFKILVFTMLSARTKDETTMNAVERLFAVADTPAKIASLPLHTLQSLLYGVGFYRQKAKNLKALAAIVAKKGVPRTLKGLVALPGVGRKTANIVLARAFGKTALGVDVHVHRISNRLGIVATKKPEETEKALIKLLKPSLIKNLNRIFVAFGQTVCLPKAPLCSQCPVFAYCWRVGVDV